MAFSWFYALFLGPKCWEMKQESAELVWVWTGLLLLPSRKLKGDTKMALPLLSIWKLGHWPPLRHTGRSVLLLFSSRQILVLWVRVEWYKKKDGLWGQRDLGLSLCNFLAVWLWTSTFFLWVWNKFYEIICVKAHCICLVLGGYWNKVQALASVAHLIGASSHNPKGRGFDSQSGHMPSLHGLSPVGAGRRGNWSHLCLFLSLSPQPLPLSLKKKKEKEMTSVRIKIVWRKDVWGGRICQYFSRHIQVSSFIVGWHEELRDPGVRSGLFHPWSSMSLQRGF